ncbi:MAG: hypothetical protein DWQ07_00765 [Chloroflexi bacterium]|nr:MAG: hypothetical protein DWQ07_00765 [Chloroflexota bacterium]MBL1195864.1 hypothetical protein [Chloroflexota bacterium]NOH13156.1 hypothetical protein [Chloroflexota bacterium]
MSFADEFSSENPLEGTGGEMLPDKGLPFDDIGDDYETITDVLDEIDAPPDDLLAGEEVSDFLEDSISTLAGVSSVTPPEADRDRGLGAVEPIIPDDEFPVSAGLPSVEIPLPTEESARGMPIFSEAALLDPSAAAAMYDPQFRGGSASLDADRALLDLFITKPRLEALWVRIEQAQRDINQKVPNLNIARGMLDQLERARNEILAGRDNFEETERSVGEVELRIAITLRSISNSRLTFGIFFYELFLGALLAWLLVWFPPYVRDLALSNFGNDALLAFPTLATDMYVGTSALIWGGMGGVIGAVFYLRKHVSHDVDFNKQFTLWYLASPLLGMLLGAFVYLVMQAGLVALTIDNSSGTTQVTFPPPIYVLAFIVGFQQNVAYDLIRRILSVFRLGIDEEENPQTNEQA